MTTPRIPTPLPTARGGRLSGVALAVLALVLFAAGPAFGQDNDDDGVLPYHEGSAPEGGGSGSGSTSGASVGTTIAIAGTLHDGLLDARRTHVALSTAAGGSDHVLDADLEDATFTGAGSQGLNVLAQDDAVRLQGDGALVLQVGLEAEAHAADDAVAGHVLLVLDDGSAGLADVLDGKTQPDLIVSLGDLKAADLVVFQGILDHHAADLPGVHATLVFASVDASGELHLSALRGSTAGGPIEVLTR